MVSWPCARGVGFVLQFGVGFVLEFGVGFVAHILEGVWARKGGRVGVECMVEGGGSFIPAGGKVSLPR